MSILSLEVTTAELAGRDAAPPGLRAPPGLAAPAAQRRDAHATAPCELREVTKDRAEIMNKSVSNHHESPQIFERLGGLVLGCINISGSDSRRILQHFSRSTRSTYLCTAQILKKCQQMSFIFVLE